MAYLVGLIDDYVKHIVQEHKWEPVTWRNLETEGQRKATVDRDENTEDRRVVRGFWNSSKKRGCSK